LSRFYPSQPWPYYVIIANGIYPWERNRMHELIKANTASWWHYFPDVWIVAGGQTAAAWRDLFSDVVSRKPSSVLVFQVSSQWAGRASSDKLAWLAQALGGTVTE